MHHSITLRDIARALNLSVSTVSRALTDSYQIGHQTKQRVLAYAKAHQYVPNRLARGLKEGKSRAIGVVVCSIDNNFVAQMLDGIDQYCNSAGYHLIIMQSKESFVQENECIHLLHAGGADGLLISPSYQTTDFSYLQQLQQTGFPVVLFDRLSEGIHTHMVAADHFKGAYQATRHLLENGFRRIAHFNSNTKLSMASKRFEGYQQALQEAGIQVKEDWIKFIDTSHVAHLNSHLEAAIKEIMNLDEPPDAIFTATDQLSTQCLMKLREMAIAVPHTLGLIGFSNTDMASAFYPSLSTVHQPAFQIGELAAKKLIQLIKNKNADVFETVLLDTHLQVRESSHR